jgi:hypothetical protein
VLLLDRPIPASRYQVIAVTAAGELVRGRTTTPETFAVSDWVLLDESGENVRRIFATYASAGDSVYPANSVIYADGLLEARFRRPNVPAFQVGVFSLDLDSDYVIEPESFDEEDFAGLDRQGASPALEGRDGTLRLPWFAIFFQGRYKLRILALDRNAFDYVRSTPQDNSGFAFGGNLGGPSSALFSASRAASAWWDRRAPIPGRCSSATLKLTPPACSRPSAR